MTKRSQQLVSVVIAVCLAACVTTTDGDRPNRLSTEDEKQIGRTAADQVEQDNEVLADDALQAYVQRIGGRLARVSTRQDLEYTFKVIDAPDTINAFALPGGYMYIYTGLLKLCENEAELASVMAHEIGHVAAKHHGESLTRQQNAQAIAALLLGEDPGTWAQVAAMVGITSVEARFSRGQEYEADRLGMEFLFRAGYNPEATVSFMGKLMNEEQARGGVWLPIFASHPPTTRRLDSLHELLGQYPAALRDQSPLYAERYRKECLDRL